MPDTVATLALHNLPFMPASGMKATTLEYDYSDDWIEMTLPAWARGIEHAVASIQPTPRAAKGRSL